MDELCVVFPVYNERETIESVLKEWTRELQKQSVEYRFVVCEDGSTDGTAELLKKLQEKYSLTLNQKKKRRGYGRAVIDGIETAKSKYVLCVDSDGQCDPADFKKFWQKRSPSEVLIGRRTERIDAAQRKIFSTLFKSLFDMLFPSDIHDPSAPFVLFRKSVIMPHLKDLTYLNEGFWWGFVGTCVKRGISIVEIPINHRPRLAGETNVYRAAKIPSIALRNIIGLVRLKLA